MRIIRKDPKALRKADFRQPARVAVGPWNCAGTRRRAQGCRGDPITRAIDRRRPSRRGRIFLHSTIARVPQAPDDTISSWWRVRGGWSAETGNISRELEETNGEACPLR